MIEYLVNFLAGILKIVILAFAIAAFGKLIHYFYTVL